MKLRIGYRQYTVVPMDQTEAAEKDALGTCNRHTGIIKVAPQNKNGPSPGDDLADTLLHEVLHAIWHERGLPGDDEEDCVTGLAHGLIAAMRDNPAFFPMLAEMVDGKIPPALRAKGR